MLAPVLSLTAQLNQFLLSPIHATLFPFPLITSLHATRVSLAYRANVTRVGKIEEEKARLNGVQKETRTWLMDVAGFLVMAWGGSFVSNYLIQSTPPQLLSFFPLVQYLSIHLSITLLLSVFPSPSAKLLDTIFPFLDGGTRTGALIGGLLLSTKHSPSPLESSSLNSSITSSSFTLPLILATISTSFGGQLAGTLSVFSANWEFKTPPILKAKDLSSSLDVWAPLLAAFFHGSTNSWHPIYVKLRMISGISQDGSIVLGQEGAKALVCLIISMAFAGKTLVTHWSMEVKKGSKSKVGVQMKLKEKKLK